MVRLDDRVKRIRERYVDRGSYFVINRGRQYGKTTTLRALAEFLKKDYIVLSTDFQELSTEEFKDETTFSHAFSAILADAFRGQGTGVQKGLLDPIVQFMADNEKVSLRELFVQISKFCKTAEKPIVLMIDEVDSASNNQVFLDFLALLRRYYLDRKNKPTFQSVILAGVYDIKNLKQKLRPEDEHKYNSPWNIAAKFNIPMGFSTKQIVSMLQEYEADKNTGMDVEDISECIYDYTSGYPYLVSAICKLLDEEIPELAQFAGADNVWTREGVVQAVKNILNESTLLFDNMVKQLDIYKDLRGILEDIIYRGEQIVYSPIAKSVNMGVMFGYLKEENGRVIIANRIFEMALLNMFITEESTESEAYRYGQRDKNQFIKDSRLDMELVLEKFVTHFHDIYGENDERFIESYGRKFFLLYLKPIINGTGNYYIEAQTRDSRRTDVIVDYLGEQFVVELKIWHGNEYNERGEQQLADYLEYFHLEKGYMLSFNFNKNKEIGLKEMRVGGKTIVEAVV